MLAHIVHELEKSPAWNPWVGCTFMDEDMVGKTMKLVRGVSAQTIMTRVIEFYSAKLRVDLHSSRNR